MKIKLLALGEKMPVWVKDGFVEYQKRLTGSSIKLKLIELPIAKRMKTGSINVWLAQEAKTVLLELNAQDHLVILDIQSNLISTEDLVIRMKRWQQNMLNIVILIGGPNGIDESIKALAKEKLSLSKMTFPHSIVRIIFIEQIYRAWTILQGYPYHK